MKRVLTQKEIDALIEALNTVKSYGYSEQASEDILKNQVVLSQAQIDELIESLTGGGKDAVLPEPDVRVVLTQPEIDTLVTALQTLKDYSKSQEFSEELVWDQRVLSQEEIDSLIARLVNK